MLSDAIGNAMWENESSNIILSGCDLANPFDTDSICPNGSSRSYWKRFRFCCCYYCSFPLLVARLDGEWDPKWIMGIISSTLFHSSNTLPTIRQTVGHPLGFRSGRLKFILSRKALFVVVLFIVSCTSYSFLLFLERPRAGNRPLLINMYSILGSAVNCWPCLVIEFGDREIPLNS